MKAWMTLWTLILIVSACNKDESPATSNQSSPEFISAVDISSYPEVALSSPAFTNRQGDTAEFLDILKAAGINTVRLRLWHNPSNVHSSLAEVNSFSQELKNKGFKIWLSLHYSDTWADPGQQRMPIHWQSSSFDAVMDSIYQYTAKVAQNIRPEFIQIGNEINAGFLHPVGELHSAENRFIRLLDTASLAVRRTNTNTKIMLHYAGITGSEWFFNEISLVDYDIIALSYYPIWHGKDLSELRNKMELLSQTHQKEIIIAETAYPFTLQWNDWTNNIVGLSEQLILPDYPASPEGQRAFIQNLRTICEDVNGGIGLCYWGAELIAWKGNQATDASPWENQALFDFSNQAVPALYEMIPN